MVDTATASLIVNIISITFGVMVSVGGIVWGLSKVLTGHRAAVTKQMDGLRETVNTGLTMLRETVNRRTEELTHTMVQHELDDERRFALIHTEIDQAGDAVRNDIGQTVTAIRTHIHGIEMLMSERRLEVERLLQGTRGTIYERLQEHNDGISDQLKGIAERLRQIEIEVATIPRSSRKKPAA